MPKVYPHVIGICGSGYGVGKTTLALFLLKRLKAKYGNHVYLESIATPLKTAFRSMFNYADFADCEDKTQKRDELCGKSVREALQTLGVCWGREKIGEDFWINMYLKNLLETYKSNDIVICDDLRFSNELHKLRDIGAKVIYVSSSVRGTLDPEFKSEGNLGEVNADVSFINDGNFSAIDAFADMAITMLSLGERPRCSKEKFQSACKDFVYNWHCDVSYSDLMFYMDKAYWDLHVQKTLK